jgi:hypothetical protein
VECATGAWRRAEFGAFLASRAVRPGPVGARSVLEGEAIERSTRPRWPTTRLGFHAGRPREAPRGQEVETTRQATRAACPPWRRASPPAPVREARRHSRAASCACQLTSGAARGRAADASDRDPGYGSPIYSCDGQSPVRPASPPDARARVPWSLNGGQGGMVTRPRRLTGMPEGQSFAKTGAPLFRWLSRLFREPAA